MLKEARRELHFPNVNLPPAKEVQIQPPPKNRPRKIIRENPDPVEVKATTPADRDKSVRPESDSDPNVKFEAAWQSLEGELVRKARAMGFKRVKKPRTAVLHLMESGLVPDQFQSVWERVIAVYEAAKRYPNRPIDQALASEFKRTCDILLEYLA
jgi:hypothetical protein